MMLDIAQMAKMDYNQHVPDRSQVHGTMKSGGYHNQHPISFRVGGSVVGAAQDRLHDQPDAWRQVNGER
jgi:hypothetical protein